MLHLLILGIFIYNTVNSTALPWNTVLPVNTTTNSTNPATIPVLVQQNIPWFWPFIAFIMMLATDYILAIKRGIDLKTNLIAVAIAYTALAYVMVAGGLSDSAYAYGFAFIMVLAVLITTLFQNSIG